MTGIGEESPGRERGDLEPGEAALIEVSAALAAGDEESLETALLRARERTSRREVEEVLLQSYLFLGYPAALNGFALWRSLCEAEASAEEGSPWTVWRARGEEVCRRVYGDQYRELRENVRRLHPEMEEWMITEGYGKVLARPGLELRVRELAIVALLAVRDVPVQLYSHLRGALRTGATAAQVEGALAAAESRTAAAAGRRAREAWRRVRARAG